MNFAEIRFWELLFAGLGCILVLRMLLAGGNARPEWLDKAALLSLGLFLLGCVSWLTLAIFLVIAVGTYVGLWWILQKEEKRRWKYLFVLIPLQFLPLFYYKYANFAANEVLNLKAGFLQGLVIPVGISFYTFQKVAFAIDTLHFRKPLPRFLEYLNFTAFFPQIVAGPIERRQDLLPQMEEFRFRWLPQWIDEGVGWITLGLFFKCCLADNFALHFDASSQSNAYRIWLANVVFGLRIYYDFAGYSLVAVGLARCLGIRLTLNFTSPLCATSATEFWRRWHITLSQWFRDYLYIPLGGSRTPRWPLVVAVVFVVSGIWHGAGWNFVLWGALHGGYLIANRTVGPWVRLPAFFAWLLTTLATCLAWLSFYEHRTAVLFTKVGTLFNPTAYGSSALREVVAQLHASDSLVLVCTLVLAALTLILEWRSLAAKNEPYAFLRRPKMLAVLILLTMILAPGTHNEFIYFAF